MAKRVDFEEFKRNVKMRMDVPQKDHETEKAYFKRLRDDFGCRSRFWHQTLTKAMKEAGTEDMDKLYDTFKRVQSEMNENRKNIETSGEEKGPVEEIETKIPGQIEMELPKKEQEEPDRIVKLMRFQAHEVDKIVKAMSECFDLLIMKVDTLNNTMSMVLRAIRRE